MDIINIKGTNDTAADISVMLFISTSILTSTESCNPRGRALEEAPDRNRNSQ